MKPIRLILALCSLAVAAAASAQPDTRFNRAPLQPRPYAELPIGAVKPAGWLNEQLVRMRDGMTGHLDSLYPQVMGPRNGWLGGDGDVWERGPYWIDGLLPLAYILEDRRLIAKVQPWIEWALASQTADGNFGPVTDRPAEPGLQRDKARDWWPRMVVLKVLQQYHSATGDPRVLDFMGRYFRYQLAQLPRTPLDNWTKWGRVRGGDNLAVVYWLYNLTGEKFLLELGELIHKQTFDWTGAFLHGDHLSRPYSLHCVDLGQGFKEPVVYWQQSGDSRHIEAVGRAVEKMRHTIGLPTGLWAGDEKLRFGDPTLGSELCTAVEMMFSLEQILQITGGREWGDYLERVAYNALPTQTTDAQDARQYYQQVNQVEVTRKVRPFSTPHEDTDIVFGMLCEAWGLVFAVLTVLCIITLAVFAVRACRAGRSSFYTIAACAATSLLVFQTCLNVFGAVDILPFTGVTLPFVSNGGSSMLSAWGMLAFLKATDTRQNASFAVRLPSRRELRGED